MITKSVKRVLLALLALSLFAVPSFAEYLRSPTPLGYGAPVSIDVQFDVSGNEAVKFTESKKTDVYSPTFKDLDAIMDPFYKRGLQAVQKAAYGALEAINNNDDGKKEEEGVGVKDNDKSTAKLETYALAHDVAPIVLSALNAIINGEGGDGTDSNLLSTRDAIRKLAEFAVKNAEAAGKATKATDDVVTAYKNKAADVVDALKLLVDLSDKNLNIVIATIVQACGMEDVTDPEDEEGDDTSQQQNQETTVTGATTDYFKNVSPQIGIYYATMCANIFADDNPTAAAAEAAAAAAKATGDTDTAKVEAMAKAYDTMAANAAKAIDAADAAEDADDDAADAADATDIAVAAINARYIFSDLIDKLAANSAL